ncbi:acetoacetate decarboxylase family protein [Amycolatopsis sp. ATCC 39116]|uniref:acetoacetate decarboxylase family protein n=1 Tax=Amycolatopsis sp. (strain ATCC 39116 / 75iv2) TaxID=385957 RepID=UPI0002627CE6|nr:acetoacetate decarboxylase family protein [Amycolatopsis sp. ATCC 39116]
MSEPVVAMPPFAPLYGVGTESVRLRWLTVEYRTDPQAVASLLPAPLAATPDPLVGIWVAEFLGAGFHLPDGTVEQRPPYLQAGISVRCHRHGEVGAYPLTFFIEGLNHGTLGREIFGLPKKQARAVTLTEEGGAVTGRIVTANDIEVLTVRARATTPAGPLDPVPAWFGNHFALKLIPSAEGTGYDISRLVRIPFRTSEPGGAWDGTAEVTLRPSTADPVQLLPCREVASARYGGIRLDIGFGTYLDHVDHVPVAGTPHWGSVAPAGE